ncbi:hypothetical protein EXIGLDRAFT_841626 [Exidia glandulosa HHB12029]|uniref:F-box domain-containing protein n=1 Tax=Exidia glandulosa HHB12029 TaxID=1314781 RepID=A0A165DS34_EXIGL|nr:hypothetical protein EXIGLDRAFT_841626 [Exidia glandulosa HHB12029]
MTSASLPLQPRLAALTAAVSAVCDEFFAFAADANVEQSERLWDTIRSSVTAEVAASIRRRNIQCSSLYRLPSEVFEMILVPLDFKDRLSVARVCSLWRDLSSSCSVLLPVRSSLMTSAEKRRFGLQLEFMGHPRIDLLNVFFDAHWPDFVSTTAFICDHMWHMETLEVLIVHETVGSDRYVALARCLSTPAPRLRRIKLGFDNSEELPLVGCPFICNWFAGYAPDLRRCDFYGAAFYAPAFLRVRTASFFMDDRTRLEHVCAVLCEFPCLESLHLSTGDFFTSRSTAALTASSTLKRLWLDLDVAENIIHVDYNLVAHIVLLSYLPIPIPSHIERLIPSPIVALDIYPQRSGYMSILRSLMIRASYTKGRARVFTLGNFPDNAALRDITAFAEATEVSLYNPHFLGGATLPCLPSARHLNLFIPPACSLQDVRAVFRASGLPNIQELALTFTCEPGAAYPSRSAHHVDELVHFLRSEPQTVQLVIRGADIIGPGLTDLRARVSVVRVDSQARVLDVKPPWVSATEFEEF